MITIEFQNAWCNDKTVPCLSLPKQLLAMIAGSSKTKSSKIKSKLIIFLLN